jgi:hypothetical protein
MGGGVIQMIQHLPRMHKALGSIQYLTNNNKVTNPAWCGFL